MGETYPVAVKPWASPQNLPASLCVSIGSSAAVELPQLLVQDGREVLVKPDHRFDRPRLQFLIL